jgi:SAM-dependent methyltransferase
VRTRREKRSPTPESLQRIDAAISSVRPDARGLDGFFADYARDHRVRLAFDIDYVERYTQPGDRILECGAVPLLLTAALSGAGRDLYSVDVDPSRFGSAVAAGGLRVERVDIEREPLPFDDASFDLALFNELFEHLRVNPIFTLSEVRRVLRPHGVLFVSTPNLRSLAGLLNFVRGRAYSCAGDVFEEYQKLDTLGHMGHVREYTTREVVDFLERLGFRTEEVIYRGRFASRLGWKAGVTAVLPSLRPFFMVVARRER